jgi:3-deoxy-D-manno-octulosonic-acid transferase
LSVFFYNLFLLLYSVGIRIAATWNPKARSWINGRKKGLPGPINPHKSPLVWMHCASLGEFEQGRPVLESIRNAYPACKIVLTFFSPSGYEIRKDYLGADHVLYLPMDNPLHSAKFIRQLQPSLVIWVKYEYWYYYLSELKNRHIPVLLVSGIFRESQPFFRWYGGLWKQMLQCFRQLFVQTNHSKALLETIGIRNVSVTGDTRFDRVTAIASAMEPLPASVIRFCGDDKVLVAGSTWEADETELIHYAKIHPEIKFIIAPHEIDQENIRDVQKEFPNAILFSLLEANPGGEHNVLIIDNIGLLSKLYSCADITYVGGGFNDSGIHNILEAAVFGKPVIFGPEYDKFAEAKTLVESGGAFSISNAIELEALLNKLFEQEDDRREAGDIAKDFVYGNRGATQQIMGYIQENRLLIS